MNTNYHITMKDLPVTEQPYEKCERFGAEVLSDAELLAIILKNGDKGHRAIDLAFSLLNIDENHPGLEGLLKVSTDRLRKIRGIGRVKSIQLMAVLELAKRISRTDFTPGYEFKSPADVARYYMPSMRSLTQEELRVMMLDTRNHMIRDCFITRGTVNSAMIDTREIFIQALRERAVNIILVHNHPSGDATPSIEDISATEQVKKAGKLIGINLIDHLVIGNGTFTSICSS